MKKAEHVQEGSNFLNIFDLVLTQFAEPKNTEHPPTHTQYRK